MQATTRDAGPCRDVEAAVWGLVESLDAAATAMAGTSWADETLILGPYPRSLWHVLMSLTEQLDGIVGRRNANAKS